MTFKVVLAHGHSSLEIFHSLFPFFLKQATEDFEYSFLDYRLFDITKSSGDCLIIVRKYQVYDLRFETIEKEVEACRLNYKKIIYFDDSAAISYIMFDIVNIVDQYWVRGLLKDRNMYTKPLYGGRTYSEFYHNKFGVADHFPTISPSTNNFDSKKIRIAWNIGMGCFPFSSNHLLGKYYTYIKKMTTGLSMLYTQGMVRKVSRLYYKRMIQELDKEIIINESSYSINARFSYALYTESVGYQRKVLLSKLKNIERIETDRLSPYLYLKQSRYDFALLSPFGWGEICYRDFEAAFFGKLLIKPNMNHIDTWPNIYRLDNYLSISWDFEDIEKVTGKGFLEGVSASEMINKTRGNYLNAFLNINKRVDQLMMDIRDETRHSSAYD